MSPLNEKIIPGSLLLIKDTQRYEVYDRKLNVGQIALIDSFSSEPLVLKQWKKIQPGNLLLCVDIEKDKSGCVYVFIWSNKKFYISDGELYYAFIRKIFEHVKIEESKGRRSDSSKS